MEADGKERDGEGAGAVSGINSRQDKNKTALTTLDDRDKTILKRVSPQKNISLALAHITHFLTRPLLTPYLVLVTSYIFFIYNYPYLRADDLF